MTLSFTGRKRFRKYFGHMVEVAEMPNLIEVQKTSYDQFLQVEKPEGGRIDMGLEAVFKSVFPISDFSESSLLEYVDYHFEEPKYDVEECQQRSMTYAAPLKVTLRLIVFDVDQETGAKSVKDIKEQDVYMGDVPFMTMNGTFVVNGTERVIVSQMHRSPGVFFDHDKGKTHSSGKLLFAARVIPYRGSWLDFEFDAKDIIHVRIDRRRKLPATTLLYALGLDQEGILDYFYTKVPFRSAKDGGWTTPVEPTWMRNAKPNNEWTNPKTGEVLTEPGQKITVRALRKWQEEGIKAVAMSDEELAGRYSALDMVNVETGEIYVEAGDELTLDNIGTLRGSRLQRDRHDQCRSHQYRRLYPQHDGGGQEPLPRAGAHRHLSRDAPRRAANGRNRRDSVRPVVLRFRALRPFERRPGEDEHAPGPRLPRHDPHAQERGHPGHSEGACGFA